MKFSEIVYSLQGEGPNTGVPSIFIRYSKCNLNCGDSENAKWKCDTKHLMNTGKDYKLEQVIEWLKENELYRSVLSKTVHLVLTGGEPLSVNSSLFFANLLSALKSYYAEIETNGTQFNDRLVLMADTIICSPKLSSSGISTFKRFKPKIILKLLSMSKSIYFKFLVATTDDLIEVKYFIDKFRIPRKLVYIIPAAVSREELTEKLPVLFRWCVQEKYKLSNRLHIQIFDRKGE